MAPWPRPPFAGECMYSSELELVDLVADRMQRRRRRVDLLPSGWVGALLVRVVGLVVARRQAALKRQSASRSRSAAAARSA